MTYYKATAFGTQFTKEQLERLAEEFEKDCLSLYDGCRCGLQRDHEGPHECPAAEICGQKPWTTQDARAWIAGLGWGHFRP